MAGGFNLDDYVDVAERVSQFYERYPNGTLRCKEWSIVVVDGNSFFVYVAQALREPNDPAPAEGIAWEPVPGQTPYTKSSEAMVCETSAWGRAIAALGFEVKRGIASRQEVENRRNGDEERAGFASDKQKTFFDRLLKKRGFDSNQIESINRFAETLPTERVSKAIDGLNDDNGDEADKAAAALMRLSDEYARKQSDVPYDDSE